MWGDVAHALACCVDIPYSSIRDAEWRTLLACCVDTHVGVSSLPNRDC